MQSTNEQIREQDWYKDLLRILAQISVEENDDLLQFLQNDALFFTSSFEEFENYSLLHEKCPDHFSKPRGLIYEDGVVKGYEIEVFEGFSLESIFNNKKVKRQFPEELKLLIVETFNEFDEKGLVHGNLSMQTIFLTIVDNEKIEILFIQPDGCDYTNEDEVIRLQKNDREFIHHMINL